jgi:inosine/xanthosine triphosphatase
LKVAIGSKNPAKVRAVTDAFGEEMEIIPLDVPSGVEAQPFSDEETMKGAVNRAQNCLKESDAVVGIGLEGGVTQSEQGLFLCNWGAMADRNGEIVIAGGARVRLPDEIAQRLLAGEELGPVMDDFTKKKNIRKKEGAIGVFTNERITRSEMFQHILQLLIGQYEYKKRQPAG